jgi:hypothetical protein
VLLAGGKVEHERIILLASSDSRPESDGESRGIRSLLLSLLDLRAPREDDNPALTAALRAVAVDAVRERVRRDA